MSRRSSVERGDLAETVTPRIASEVVADQRRNSEVAEAS
jgi:hypothetical protein